MLHVPLTVAKAMISSVAPDDSEVNFEQFSALMALNSRKSSVAELRGRSRLSQAERATSPQHRSTPAPAKLRSVQSLEDVHNARFKRSRISPVRGEELTGTALYDAIQAGVENIREQLNEKSPGMGDSVTKLGRQQYEVLGKKLTLGIVGGELVVKHSGHVTALLDYVDKYKFEFGLTARSTRRSTGLRPTAKLDDQR